MSGDDWPLRDKDGDQLLSAVWDDDDDEAAEALESIDFRRDHRTLDFKGFLIQQYLDNALQIACERRSVHMVKRLLKAGAHPNVGLQAACGAHDHELMNLMILHGAQNWDDALEAACRSAYTRGCNGGLIHRLIDRGPTKLADRLRDVSGLWYDFGLAKLLVNRGAAGHDMAFLNACEFNHKELAEHLVGLGLEPVTIASGFPLIFHCRGGFNASFADWLFGKATVGPPDLNEALRVAARKAVRDLTPFRYLADKGATAWSDAVQGLMDNAMATSELIAFALNQGGTMPSKWRYPQLRPLVMDMLENRLVTVALGVLAKSIGGMHKFTKDINHRHALIRKYLGRHLQLHAPQVLSMVCDYIIH